ncbi:MAG: biotin transporter BioY [bacterium]
MDITDTLGNLEKKKENYYEWLHDLAWAKRLFLALLVAVVTGIAAQIRIPLGFTPVPITGQVFIVLLCGVLLGNIYGGLSMILYMAIGFAGVPWFSGATSGLPIGPTTGYIIGFVPAAFLIGFVTQRYKQIHSFLFLLGLMMVAILIIYICGAAHFALFMKTNLKTTLYMAVLPFLPIDLIKALFAACTARILLPKHQI